MNPNGQRVYYGHRMPDGTAVVRIHDANGKARKLRLHLSKCNHSPTGIEWGYGGNGPAQLAFEILYDVLGDDELAYRLHQRFKWERITPLPRSASWSMTEQEVLQWAENTTRRSRNAETK